MIAAPTDWRHFAGLTFSAGVFNMMPFAFTLAGQYTIKDIVLVSAGLVLGGAVRGEKQIADPVVAEKAQDVEEHTLAREDGQPLRW